MYFPVVAVLHDTPSNEGLVIITFLRSATTEGVEGAVFQKRKKMTLLFYFCIGTNRCRIEISFVYFPLKYKVTLQDTY